MEKKRLLIATLGTSPAVVTEAIDLLSEQGQRPDRVCIIKTKDPDVNRSYELLLKHIPAHCGIELVKPVEIQSYKDIDSSDIAIKFMRQACDILRTYSNNYELYVCIAGGRKVMSALLALAVNLYGAERLFHIWAPRDLENNTEIRLIRGCAENELIKLLHPKLGDLDSPRIVDLPLTDN
jgi:CRISPR-associated protein Csx14